LNVLDGKTLRKKLSSTQGELWGESKCMRAWNKCFCPYSTCAWRFIKFHYIMISHISNNNCFSVTLFPNKFNINKIKETYYLFVLLDVIFQCSSLKKSLISNICLKYDALRKWPWISQNVSLQLLCKDHKVHEEWVIHGCHSWYCLHAHSNYL